MCVVSIVKKSVYQEILGKMLPRQSRHFAGSWSFLLEKQFDTPPPPPLPPSHAPPSKQVTTTVLLCNTACQTFFFKSDGRVRCENFSNIAHSVLLSFTVDSLPFKLVYFAPSYSHGHRRHFSYETELYLRVSDYTNLARWDCCS
jgi:hypothetical protein